MNRSTPYTVAIMQPYFIPYAGYFRLFAASDLFVVYDCVQFPRRGWVHRNKMIDASGTPRWVTLPLAKAPQNVLIKELEFLPDAPALLAERLRPFPALKRTPPAAKPVLDALMNVSDRPLVYIERLLETISTYLGLPWNVVRSSSFAIPEELKGQDRILEIVRRIGARRYINPSGGRHLYRSSDFADAGVTLDFLPTYSGPTSSILTRILTEDRSRLAADVSNFAFRTTNSSRQ